LFTPNTLAQSPNICLGNVFLPGLHRCDTLKKIALPHAIHALWIVSNHIHCRLRKALTFYFLPGCARAAACRSRILAGRLPRM
jgi:hypothetical protein